MYLERLYLTETPVVGAGYALGCPFQLSSSRKNCLMLIPITQQMGGG